MTAALIDPFGRRIDYLRVSVTDRCDLRCSYCLPAGHKGFTERERVLDPAGIERVVRTFARLGVKRVRLTGGEPLVRRDITDIVGRIAAVPGIDDVSLSTNGTLLAPLAQGLAEAGLRRVNVSLDTLDPVRYRDITGTDALSKVLDGIETALAAGLKPVKLNALAMAGLDREVEGLLEYAMRNGLTLRFIEPMPVGDTGRAAMREPLDLRAVRRRIEARYDTLPDVAGIGGGPARYLRVVGSDTRVGFITPISQHFCDTCNRVRLGADGALYGCLGRESRVDLGPALRAKDDAALLAAIVGAVRLRPERHDFLGTPDQVVRFMAMTGG